MTKRKERKTYYQPRMEGKVELRSSLLAVRQRAYLHVRVLHRRESHPRVHVLALHCSLIVVSQRNNIIMHITPYKREFLYIHVHCTCTCTGFDDHLYDRPRFAHSPINPRRPLTLSPPSHSTAKSFEVPARLNALWHNCINAHAYMYVYELGGV